MRKQLVSEIQEEKKTTTTKNEAIALNLVMNKTVVAKPKEFKLQLYFLKLKCVFFHADSLNFAPTKKLNEKKNASTEHQRPIDFCIQSKPKQKQTQKTIEIHTVVHKYSYGCKRN